MAAFEYRQAEEIRDCFDSLGVKYLFLGKSGAILLGYPDTTQDADIYVQKSQDNGEKLLAALQTLGFQIEASKEAEILRCKDFIQLKDGPFDLDLIFAPDGIENFEIAWDRRMVVEGFPVCHIDDILASKKAANRPKDKESLPRLLSFRDWLLQNKKHPAS